MKKAYLVYFYTPDGKRDSDFFVANDGSSLEGQFLAYSKYTYGTAVKKNDVDYIVEIDEISDAKGNIYKTVIKK